MTVEAGFHTNKSEGFLLLVCLVKGNDDINISVLIKPNSLSSSSVFVRHISSSPVAVIPLQVSVVFGHEDKLHHSYTKMLQTVMLEI